MIRRLSSSDLFCAFTAVFIVIVLIREYFLSGVFHSSQIDQQFLIPPMLHGIHMAWTGEGSFLFNHVTAEPMWGNPHYSPFYPFYGTIVVLMYDVFGVEDYMVIGNFITIFHRLILTLGCYYLFRSLSNSRLVAICFAVFVVTAEATRIPANWYMAFSAFSWVPFMLGGCIDIYFSRFARGVSVLTISTVLSVFAAPIYLGLGIALIPCVVIVTAFLVRFIFSNMTSSSNAKRRDGVKTLSFLVLSACGLLLLISPILIAAYIDSEHLIRWLRSGPVVGRSSASVGNELFHETMEFSYLKRLVTDYGIRGVFSSYFLGGIVAFLFVFAPFVWLHQKHQQSKAWFSIRLIIWSLAVLHLSFIFGEKLIVPKILYSIPVVSAFRHLTAFGTAFILLASLCAFDCLYIALQRAFTEKRFQRRRISRDVLIVLGMIILALTLLIFNFTLAKGVFGFALILIISGFVFLEYSRHSTGSKKITLSVFVVLVSAGAIYQQQLSSYNEPMRQEKFASHIDELNALMVEIPTEGELIFSNISADYAKKNKISGMHVQSYLSTKNYPVSMSYLTPRHHGRFQAGLQLMLGSTDVAVNSGVTLLITDKNFFNTEQLKSFEAKGYKKLNSTESFNLYRLQDSALLKDEMVCLNHNLCGYVENDFVDFRIFPFKALKFSSKQSGSLPVIDSPKSKSLSRVKPAGTLENTQWTYRPAHFLPLMALAFFGMFISILSVRLLMRDKKLKLLDAK